MAEVIILPDAEAVAQKAADMFAQLGQPVVAHNSKFSVALAGGSTPQRMYEILAERKSFPWDHTLFFWGDERDVLPESPQSNYRMANEALLSRVAIPQANVFPVPTRIGIPAKCAAEYQQFLMEKLGAPIPMFDLIILGMGEDGHTASLFSGTQGVKEQNVAFMANFVKPINAWRYTITPPVIKAARRVLILVTGSGKAGRLKEVFESENAHLPVSLVNQRKLPTVWLLDKAAASELPKTE